MYYADAFSTRSGPPNSLRLELLERLQAGVEPCWAEVAELLRTTFHAAHCVVTLHHAPGVHEILATSGLTVEWEARYEETYSGSNPFVVEAHRRRTQGMESLVAAADRLVPPAELQKMPFFHEFWAPLGINDGVGVVLFDGTRSLGHISIRRKSNGIRYGEAEEARLRSVVDILRAALIRSRELRILEARAAAFDRFNIDQRGGLIVFDERNAVLAAEGTGRTLIDNFRLELMDAIAANRNDGSGSYLTIPPRTYDHSPKPGSAHSTDANNAAPRFSIELRRSVIEGRVRL
ncbi:MAG: hypothetical protein ACKVS6_10830, partial [Planctomycetota bacterium]